MELIDKKCISSVTLFNVELSEGELMVYEGCIDYVLNNCTDELISQLTGCEGKQELSYYRDELLRVIKMVCRPDYLPDKYKKL